ncbi:ABC transporter permease subunit [Leifsonia sp. H3M29-4]|uniref:ABC transporter permease n=1 Tax=Salinibacterium metalliresistens TaxID=3031321 RepID=UPI0023DAEFFC|nr:ABC transporter permease subunit [Salinibacterium metalliresistens]MDF1478253.1 ABC transporter permease subunit [Salinibacterium metalliresistens]
MTFALGALRRIGLVIAATAVVLGLWWAFLIVARISPFIGKSPLDVWNYLVTAPEAQANRTEILDNVAITLNDTVIGYSVGLAGALLIAIVFVLLPPVETTFMPVAMVLRTFPLIALTPLIILGFGRGAAGLAAIGFIVVFFAALITITFGLRSTPRSALDVVTVYGGGALARVTKVSLPHAVPAFFTAARVAAPHALTGALLAEWLITGKGIGAQLQQAAGTSRYAELWAAAVAIAVVTITIYTIISLIESAVVERFAP